MRAKARASWYLKGRLGLADLANGICRYYLLACRGSDALYAHFCASPVHVVDFDYAKVFAVWLRFNVSSIQLSLSSICEGQ